MLSLPLNDATSRLRNDEGLKAISVMFGSADSDQEVVTFFQALEAHEKLSSLTVDNSKGFIGLKVLIFTGLAGVLTKNTTLTELSLMGPDSCRDNGTTEFDGEAESANAFVEALAANSSLISFKFANLTLGEQATNKLLTALKTHPTLQTISFIHRFYEVGFDTDQMNLMADILRENSTLTTLTLDCQGFGDGGIRIIFEALPFNAKLATLNLGCGQISAIGGLPIAKFIAQQSPDSKLTSLSLSFPNWIVDGVTDAGLIPALKGNRALTTFCLTVHSMDCLPPLLCATAIQFNQTLRTLKLKNLGDLPQDFIESGAGVLTAIAEALESNTTLLSLDLWQGALENRVGDALAKTEQIEKINACLIRNRQILANDSPQATQTSTKPKQAPLLLQHGAFSQPSQPSQASTQTKTPEAEKAELAEQQTEADNAALEKEKSVGEEFTP